VPVVDCDARSRQSAKQVLVTLVRHALDRASGLRGVPEADGTDGTDGTDTAAGTATGTTDTAAGTADETDIAADTTDPAGTADAARASGRAAR
jgi:hypothetical protein